MKKLILSLIMTTILSPAAFAMKGHVTCLLPSQDSLDVFTQDKKVVEDAYIFEYDAAAYNEIESAKLVQTDKLIKVDGQLDKKAISLTMELQSNQQLNSTLVQNGKSESVQCVYSETNL